MSYVSFLSDEHIIFCISELYKTYETAKDNFDISKFYKNQIDPFKLMFDMKFFDMTPNEMINSETHRKIDKSVSNAIGTFHENLLGGIKGYKKLPVGHGYDISDEKEEKLFADIKNKHNTVKGSNLKDLFKELSSYIEGKEGAKAYWVQIISDGNSFDEPFEIPSHGLYNPNVRKVSADKFYAILTGNEKAFFELCEALPRAIDDFLAQNNKILTGETSEIFEIINNKAKEKNIKFEDQLMLDTFSKYDGFKDL